MQFTHSLPASPNCQRPAEGSEDRRFRPEDQHRPTRHQPAPRDRGQGPRASDRPGLTSTCALSCTAMVRTSSYATWIATVTPTVGPEWPICHGSLGSIRWQF